MKTILFLFLSITILWTQAFSSDEQIHAGYVYQKPTWTDPFTGMPRNFKTFFSDSFSKDKLGAWGLIAASTTLLVIYDREIINESQRLGRRLGIGNDDHTREMLKVGSIALFRGPTDLGSWMYFIGDGWTHFAIAGSFLGVGSYTQDYRALQTGSQLVQGLMMTALVTQVLKRTTGRESPIVSTTPTGKWNLFPSQNKYNAKISSYDAFPSGHLATATMTITIIANNYQEYTWIAPVGYTLATLLSFQMMNNAVHWASDYPLAIGIGYMIGKTVSNDGRKKVESDTASEKNKVSYSWSPIINPEGKLGMGVNISY